MVEVVSASEPLSTSSSTASKFRVRTYGNRDVGFLNSHARIVEWLACERPERPAVPADDGRHELRDNDCRGRRQRVERRAQRKTHAEAADEDAWPGHSFDATAGERSQRVLRTVLVAPHERFAVGEEEERAVTTLQREPRAVRSCRLADEDPGFHDPSEGLCPSTPRHALSRATGDPADSAWLTRYARSRH